MGKLIGIFAFIVLIIITIAAGVNWVSHVEASTIVFIVIFLLMLLHRYTRWIVLVAIILTAFFYLASLTT